MYFNDAGHLGIVEVVAGLNGRVPAGSLLTHLTSSLLPTTTLMLSFGLLGRQSLAVSLLVPLTFGFALWLALPHLDYLLLPPPPNTSPFKGELP